jgi:dihydrofolate reductase
LARDSRERSEQREVSEKRKIITTTFVTLDGAMQSPGAPQDTSGGFTQGGWSANYWDELMGNMMTGFMQLPFELLLGKRTYDIFAAFWPNTDQDQSIAASRSTRPRSTLFRTRRAELA